MTKKNIMPVAVLTAICVIVAALLAVVNLITAPIIAANAERKLQESLIAVMEGAEGFTEVELSGLPSTVKRVYEEKTGRGYVIALEAVSQYTGSEKMAITVGISREGKITGVKITAYSESKDMGRESYPSRFVGLNEAESDAVDTVSGVTYSSAAFKAAIADAFRAVEIAEGAHREDDPYTKAAKELIGTDSLVELGASALTAPVTRFWYADGAGFVVLTSTKHDYSPTLTDTEVLTAIGNDGKIIDVKILTWIHGEGTSFTPEFEDAFSGKTEDEIDGIDVITGSTGTSNKVKNSVKAAIDAARAEAAARVERLVEELIGTDATLYPLAVENPVKLVFESSSGYVVYTSTKHDYSPTLTDTELLVWLDEVGRVKEVKILTWIHGEGTSFTPEFEDAFSGKTEGEIDGIDAITGSTGTSNKVKNSVKAAVSALKSIEAVRIEAAVEELVGADATLTDTELQAPIKMLFSTSSGYVVYTATKHDYSPTLTDTELLVWVGFDCKVKEVKILTWVHGEGTSFTPEFEDAFSGRTEGEMDGVDVITGSTGTSNKVKNSVKAAIDAARAEAAARVERLVEELIGTDATLYPLAVENPVKLVFESSSGYVVYTSTKHDYSPTLTDTELLVWLDEVGRVKEVKILTWIHGEGTSFTPEFEDAFSGKTEGEIDGIDAITGSTGTSNKVKNSVKAAVSALKSIEAVRIEAAVEELVGADATLTDTELQAPIKMLFSTSSGYVVYTATKHDYSPTLTDTELLVWVGFDCKVKEVKILTWVHGEGTSFTPEFEDAFSGKTEGEVDGVDAITGSTGTSNKVKNSVKAAIAAAMAIKEGE